MKKIARLRGMQDISPIETNKINFVENSFNEISKSLIDGHDVKISSFGTFIVRNKKERIGRNPKTGEEVTITARQVVTFRSSNVLKSEVSDLSINDNSSSEVKE